jgi:hypothetical protein
MNRYLVAVEALEGGCLLEQAVALSGLKANAVDALDTALMGDAMEGADLWREIATTDIKLAERPEPHGPSH